MGKIVQKAINVNRFLDDLALRFLSTPSILGL